MRAIISSIDSATIQKQEFAIMKVIYGSSNDRTYSLVGSGRANSLFVFSSKLTSILEAEIRKKEMGFYSV